MDQEPPRGSNEWLPLLPHPDSVAETSLVAFEARVVQAGGRQLRFEYRAAARSDSTQSTVQLRLPLEHGRPRLAHPARDGRGAELWRESCCEAFLRLGVEPGYLEFNFSPSGQWAAYAFSAYRAGVRDFATRAPRIECRTLPGAAATEDPGLVTGFELQATIELPESLWPDTTRAVTLHLALTAVLQLGPEGLTTYWSLRHPRGRPDFHDSSNFALTLPAPIAASG